jgi:hypothetical protein
VEEDEQGKHESKCRQVRWDGNGREEEAGHRATGSECNEEVCKDLDEVHERRVSQLFSWIISPRVMRRHAEVVEEDAGDRFGDPHYLIDERTKDSPVSPRHALPLTVLLAHAAPDGRGGVLMESDER